MLPQIHAALLGLAAGLSWARGVRALALALGAVAVLSVAEGWPLGAAAHVLAAGACLAGVAQTCRGRGARVALTGAVVVAVALVAIGPWLGRVGVGIYLAACYIVASIAGGLAVRGPFRWPAGIMAASCATGAVGCALWGFGYSTTPAVYADLALLGAFCAVVPWSTTR